MTDQQAFRANWRRYCLGASLAGVRPPLDIRDASADVACVMFVLRGLKERGLDFDPGRVALVVELGFGRDVFAVLQDALDYYESARTTIQTHGALLARVWHIAAALQRQETAERATERAAAELRKRREETDAMIDSLRGVAA